MFFSRFFTQNPGQLKEKADKLFAAGHFADARHLYSEALEKFAADDVNSNERQYLATQISITGNSLAELNIVEAEAAIRCGNWDKAVEYLQLSLALAEDVSLRQKAEDLLNKSADTNDFAAVADKPHTKHGCATCSTSPSSDTLLHEQSVENLSADEQFQLLVNTLPGDLPLRYSQLGEKFASAFLLAHAENAGEALTLFNELLSAGENDIILYEAALLFFRIGEPATCERLLKRALQINSENPLCYLGLAQLYVDSSQFTAAVDFLNTMLERKILTDQAVIMLGDVYTLQEDYARAIETFTAALDAPALRKTAAERLVRILATQGREQEAAYLAKTYLKGCC